MPRKMKKLIGERSGKLIAVEDLGMNDSRIHMIRCVCDCGNQNVIIRLNNFRSHTTKSCGCLKKEKITTHGMSDTKIYKTWYGMNQRCSNPNANEYNNYGGRGIFVCEEWQNPNGFPAFYSWAIENGYKEGLTIDRIDNNKGYSPTNCRWVTHKEQANNMSNNRLFEYNGQTYSLSQLSELLNMDRTTLQNRLVTLELPIDIAIHMDSNPRVMYQGKMTAIKNIVQYNNVSYKDMLKYILVEGKDAEEAIRLSCPSAKII